jgi:hypothetical protein
LAGLARVCACACSACCVPAVPAGWANQSAHQVVMCTGTPERAHGCMGSFRNCAKEA